MKSAWFYPETGERFYGAASLFTQTMDPKGADLEARMQPLTGEIIVRRALPQGDGALCDACGKPIENIQAATMTMDRRLLHDRCWAALPGVRD